MTFKEKIVILRKTKGLTQDEFAKAVGVSRQAVYKWESGQSYPEVAKLLEIKALFAISIDDLLDDSFEVALPEKKKRRRAPKAVEASPAVEVEAAPAVEEAPAAEVEAAPAVEQTPAPEAEEKAEKRGFFSRLFSRR
ncbi:MAG: helix-turn-helix transcriptional regulator [Clostridia bacterium]|nr:helix-turn-helix transcriptional regulator [Clostridia bacterium]